MGHAMRMERGVLIRGRVSRCSGQLKRSSSWLLVLAGAGGVALGVWLVWRLLADDHDSHPRPPARLHVPPQPPPLSPLPTPEESRVDTREPLAPPPGVEMTGEADLDSATAAEEQPERAELGWVGQRVGGLG
jgi:hypothetical protein